MIHLVDDSILRKPRLAVVESTDVRVPPETSHAALLAHAGRVARLVAELSVAEGVSGARGLTEHCGWVWLPMVGVAMSQALDLGMETDPNRVMPWVRAHAFPSGRGSLKDALRVDVPRYQPGQYMASDHRCPMPGPRGGACHRKNRMLTKYITDSSTGDWVWAEVCPTHRPSADARRLAAPVPGPNRGGVLARVFHEYDIDPVYQWADDRYTPTGEVVGASTAEKPRLRVLDGGAC